VVSYNTRDNEKSRLGWYKARFIVNNLEERTHIYNIKNCERAVKDAFKSKGWVVGHGEEYFKHPGNDVVIQEMRQVFLDTTAKFLTPPSIDALVPIPPK
jgi:hypothetical protein